MFKLLNKQDTDTGHGMASQPVTVCRNKADRFLHYVLCMLDVLLKVFQSRRIQTVPLAMATFSLLMKNYRNVLLSYSRRTLNLPNVSHTSVHAGKPTVGLSYDEIT